MIDISRRLNAFMHRGLAPDRISFLRECLGGRMVSKLAPILAGKDFAAPSVFEPENLLREARRQKNLPSATVPEICVLDPDGDIVRMLIKAGRTRRSPNWACYHTDLFEFEHAGECIGIIGCAV